jgi:hypothetical protein
MEPNDEQLDSLLSQLRFESPSLDTVWQPDRGRRWIPRRMAVALAVAAVLCFAGGTMAASTGLLGRLLAGGSCPSNSVLCGQDYEAFGTRADRVDGVEAVNAVVATGLSHERLTEIAARVADDTSAGVFMAGPTLPTPAPGTVKPRRIIVYVFSGLETLPTAADGDGFPADPATDSAAANKPVADLLPYWRLTYDAGPGGVHATWP